MIYSLISLWFINFHNRLLKPKNEDVQIMILNASEIYKSKYLWNYQILLWSNFFNLRLYGLTTFCSNDFRRLSMEIKSVIFYHSGQWGCDLVLRKRATPSNRFVRSKYFDFPCDYHTISCDQTLFQTSVAMFKIISTYKHNVKAVNYYTL